MNPRGNLDPPEIDAIFSIAYAELRRLAASVKRGDGGVTLNPTALVNEAWIRLRNSPGIHAESPLHFKRIAARAMRQILVEAARRRDSQKRGGDGVTVMLSLEDAGGAPCTRSSGADEVIALERALTELEQLDSRQAQLVEARFFGGLETSELVQAFGISEATVMRDWRMARAWLAHRIRDGSQNALSRPLP